MPQKRKTEEDLRMQKLQGERLRYLRERAHLTTRELGEILGIDYSNLAGVERGDKGMSTRMLQLFSEYYNVSYDYILCRTANELQNLNYPVRSIYNILDTTEFKNALQERVIKMVLLLKDESLAAIENIVAAALERDGIDSSKITTTNVNIERGDM